MVSQIIDVDLDPKESKTVEMEISENTDKVTIIATPEDVDSTDVEMVVGWYQEETRVGGESKTLKESPFELNPFADLLKVQLRNGHESKGTKVNGNIREKKRG